MRSHELVWIAALLECVPQVEVLSVSVDNAWLPGMSSVPVAVIKVHAASWAEAQVLADALGLREDTTRDRVHESTTSVMGGKVQHFRNWIGWAAEGSHEVAVSVEVTAAEWEHVEPSRETAA